jgi:transcriptional regulator with XRE-family HTH domain
MFDIKKAGGKIAILRKEKGMTQEELAKNGCEFSSSQ